MTVTQIVQDLLDYNMITAEAAVVLLKAEADAKENKKFNAQPFWYSTTTGGSVDCNNLNTDTDGGNI